jgi:hypothetical protein
VDFDELLKRTSLYKSDEKQSYERFSHRCRIGLDR